ncbi:putative DNAJ heat shock family protein [Heracleum sosnowskyi]|uniref:DNAJ heat shock family protein n=1 Tax=Heracleum sosnowskyi TaxID=360622 RepID=A0AAD8MDC2_9APIA|nr:putative DNAJ heat shock family protein [Heracleum sosnowskyi]
MGVDYYNILQVDKNVTEEKLRKAYRKLAMKWHIVTNKTMPNPSLNKSMKPMSSGPRKAPPVENRLPCSLEELFKGTTKKMKISREIADASGKTLPVEEILTLDIKPGWKRGTKITFPQKGNEQPNVVPADVIFVVDDKPHNVFTREGNDLICTHKISLAESLTGYTVHVNDGRKLTIPVNNVIHPSYEEEIIFSCDFLVWLICRKSSIMNEKTDGLTTWSCFKFLKQEIIGHE